MAATDQSEPLDDDAEHDDADLDEHLGLDSTDTRPDANPPTTTATSPARSRPPPKFQKRTFTLASVSVGESR